MWLFAGRSVHLNQSKFGIFQQLLLIPCKCHLRSSWFCILLEIFIRYASAQVTDLFIRKFMKSRFKQCAAFLPCPHNTSFLHQVKTSCLSSHWIYVCLQINDIPLRPICVYLSRGTRSSHARKAKLYSTSNYWLLENVICSWEFKMITRAEIIKFVELPAKK